MNEPELPLRIIIDRPPAGVAWALQRGRHALVPPVSSSAAAMVFELTARVGTTAEGAPNFLGEFAHGTVADRFVYITVGESAGQAGSPWKRRAKVRLGTITREMVDAALASGGTLEARFAGTGRDGTPACATVPLLDGGWRIVPDG